MEVGQPAAAAAPRPLRIKKKPTPAGLKAPAGATAATAANSDARPPGASTLRKHAWQYVDMVREDLGDSFRPRSTEEDVNAVRQFHRSETPAEGSTQRGPTQRGPIPKFTQTGSLVLRDVILGEVRVPEDAPTGNEVSAKYGSGTGSPRKAPPLEAPAEGTDLWNARIQCHVVRMHDPPPKGPPPIQGTAYGSVFSEAVMTFEHVDETEDGTHALGGSGPKIVIRLKSGGTRGPAQPTPHGYVLHGHDIEFVCGPYTDGFPDRVHIVRKRFRSDTFGVIQVDLPEGSGESIMNFLHVFHNLPGRTPSWAPLTDMASVTGGLSSDGIYEASFWGTDWAIQSNDPANADDGSRKARPTQPTDQRAYFAITGDARAGQASLTCYEGQYRASWETWDLRDVVIEPNTDTNAVVLSLSTTDSNGHVGRFTKEIRPLRGIRRRGGGGGLSIQSIMTAVHRARLCTTRADISIPPGVPEQDLDADSGSGSGGGASAAPAATSAQAASAEADAGGAPMAIDPPANGELTEIRDGMTKLSAKPGEQKHLVVLGQGLATQFSRANQQVPNKEYVPVILEHSEGIHRIVSLLTKHDPRHVGELAYVIGDAELGPIRALPVASRTERSLVERHKASLVRSWRQ